MMGARPDVLAAEKARGIGCALLLSVLAVVWIVSLFAAPKAEFVQMRGLNNYAMILPPDVEPAAIEAAAKAKCADKQFCKVLGWTDKAQAAQELPMLAREAAALAFSYDLNRTTGFERVLWDCKRFPHSDLARCLAD
jgi:hypothetical protein